jgi:hypothetical protein
LRLLLLRPDERLLALRAEDLRPPLLRLAVDFRPPRRVALRALPELRPLDRFLAPPRLRPDDPDRDFFLALFERLDFLAAAMGKLRVRGFARTDSKIRAQQSCDSPCPVCASRAFARPG